MIGWFLPELVLFLASMLAVIFEVFFGPSSAHIDSKISENKVVLTIVIGGFSVALVSAGMLFHFLFQASGPVFIFSGTYLIDGLSAFLKFLFILIGLISVILGHASKEIQNTQKPDFYVLILLATLGSCIVSSAVHLLPIYLAYEMVIFITCILVSFCRVSPLFSEAGLKTFIFSAVTSLLFIFGIVLLFALTKSFSIIEIREFLEKNSVPAGYLWVSFGLLFVVIASRMNLFPFHLLGPDVIGGAPAPVAAYISVASCLVGVALALRLCFHVFSIKSAGMPHWVVAETLEWPQIFLVLIAISMTLTTIGALGQNNLRRLFGFSALIQLSYVLLGFVVVNQLGLTSLLFSLLVFVIANLGAFLISMRAMDRNGTQDCAALDGLVWRAPFEGVALSIFILSLAGLPPFAGFIGRTYLVGAVVKEHLNWLAMIAAFNSIIGMTFYFSLLRRIFGIGSESEKEVPAESNNENELGILSFVAILFLVIPTVVLGVYWDPLLRYISNSLNNVL